MTFLKTLPSTNLHALLTAVLVVFFVVGVTFAEVLSDREIDEGVLFVVATLIAAYGGLTGWQFKVKRQTEWKPKDIEDEEDAPDASLERRSPVPPESRVVVRDEEVI
jgi:hypothetical protein